MRNTPFFPAWRVRFANLGRHAHQLQQHSLLQLDLLLAPLLPAGLLSQADEGPNSRERIYTVRRTFFGFLYQVLKPDCACREIVRQILALRALHPGCGHVQSGHQRLLPGAAASARGHPRAPALCLGHARRSRGGRLEGVLRQSH